MIKFLLFLSLVVGTSYCAVDDFPLPNYSTAISRAVIDYIVNFYFHIASSVNMYHLSQPKHENTNLDIMNEILYHVKTKIVVQVDSLMDFQISARKRANNIIFVDSLNSFMFLFRNMDYSHFDYQGYYLIIITVPTNDIYVTMLKIFEALWSKHIINSNIIFMPPENINEAILYTYYPYSSFYCENVVPIQLNHYKNYQWLRNAEYFPKKLQNFHGCTLHVATFNNPPFMIINEDENGLVTVDGLEGILLRVLGQRFNFYTQLHLPKQLWGFVYENRTTTGAIKMVVRSRVNFTLGFFASMPDREAIMESTYSYFNTRLVWIVPPGKPQTAIEKLTNPLHSVVWVLSIITVVIGFLVIVSVRQQPKAVRNFVFGNRIQSPALNFINVILGNSLHEVPMRNFSRFLLLLAMIYYFIIRTCYTSGLVKFMQMDTRGKTMQTTADMIRSNFSFYMNEPARAYVLNLPEILMRTNFVSVDVYNSKLLDMIQDPYYNAAFLTSTGHLTYRNFKSFPKLFHESTPESIYSLNIVVYMKLGSCLTTPFNELIMNLLSNGLIKQWASYFIDNKYLKKPDDDNIKILSLDQLEGAFQLLIGGLLLGLLAFGAENLVGRNVLRKIPKLLGHDKVKVRLRKNPPRKTKSK